MYLEKLTRGHAKFLESFDKEKEFYLDLAVNGQHPKVLWIGCSDSRVVPEFVVNAKAGELFVMRNIANVIPPREADVACVGSVLEYAVEHLEVEHIIVCGHTHCGGITACVNGIEPGNHVHDWLRFAQPAIAKAKGDNKEDRILFSIKENVILQQENLLSYDYIKSKIEEGNLKIHLWLYDLCNGRISWFDKKQKEWLNLD